MANSEAGDDVEFKIHVDDSCLTDSTDLQKSEQRSSSHATVIHNDQFGTDVEKDEHTEALIQAAARDIIEKIERDAYEKKHGGEASDLSYTEDEETGNGAPGGSELTYAQETELTYEDGTEMSYEGGERAYGEARDDGYDGSASEHHEDDVFSHGRTPSGGSNNTSDAQNTDDEARYRLTKEIADEVERQQAVNQEAQEQSEQGSEEQGFFDQSCDEAENDTPMVSRVPSAATTSYHNSLHPDAATDTHLSPFRSSASMRALQMSSPAPSVFSSGSPMPRKRPSSSRLNTPHKMPPKTSKPTVIFASPPVPLTLLHIHVLPLRWSHAEIIENAPNEILSKELLAVKQSWKVLKDKLGDYVLIRGVLIPHPQDSFEMLDERLCGALELPHRPRAKILDCGHYVGPSDVLIDSDADTSAFDFSDDEDAESEFVDSGKETWCDVCERDVHFGRYDRLNKTPRKKTYKLKVYASNGLMGSGAWAACWRQMEHVDVEIEPVVEAGFSMEIAELFDMAMASRQAQEDAYGEMESSQVGAQQEHGAQAPTYHETTRPGTAVTVTQEPAYIAKRSLDSPQRPPSIRMLSPEPFTTQPVSPRIRALEDEVIRIEAEEARHREIYAIEQSEPSRSHSRSQSAQQPFRNEEQQYQEQEYQHEDSRLSRTSSRMSNRASKRRAKPYVDEDSFLELLLAVVRVLLSDAKNVVIGVLVLVVVFAWRSGGGGGAAQSLGAVRQGGHPGGFQTGFEMGVMGREGVMQRPVVACQAPLQNAAAVNVQPEVQYAVQQQVGAQQLPMEALAPAAQIQQSQQAPVGQAAFSAPPCGPEKQNAGEAKPLIQVVAPAEAERDTAAVPGDIDQIQVPAAEVLGKVGVERGDAEFAEFVIPTPPASIQEVEAVA